MSPSGRRILLVEDEPGLVITLRDRLQAEGYEVTDTQDGITAVELALNQVFDLMILDVTLPGQSGLDVCRELRSQRLAMPILMLTARAQIVDKVLGLKLGADDYLTKPFEMLELLARVEALLRRTSQAAKGGAGVHEFGSIRVDLRSTEVSRDGEPVNLTALEFKLLCYFLENPRVTKSRNQLLDDVWGYEAEVTTRTVDVHVAGLRRKLEENASRPRHFVTVHRRGYKFVE